MYATYEREKIDLDTGVVYGWKQESSSCIIFTHGLGGNIEKTWGNLPLIIMGTAFARNKDIILYSYKSSALNSNSKSIDALAKEYVTFLEFSTKKYINIYFVTHSLGSVITLYGMIDLFKKNNSWRNKVKGHILLAPALWGSLWGWLSPSKTSRELRYGSDFLKSIRKQWSDEAGNAACVSTILFGTEDKIIRKHSSELALMRINEKNVAKNHFSIPKTSSIDEITFRSIMDSLYEISGSSPHDNRNYLKSILYESQIDEWEYNSKLSEFVFKPNISLKIVQLDTGEREFDEPWVKNFPDPKAFLIQYALYYNSNLIFDFPMIYCDGFRYAIPMPDSAYNLKITSNQFKLAKIMEASGFYKDINSGIRMAGISVE